MAPTRRYVATVRLRRLSAELLRLREAVGLTREAVSEHTELNVATLYRLETARARPQRRTLKDLASVRDCARKEGPLRGSSAESGMSARLPCVDG
jgi:transcriptional regulator with XRE-family HTH domain